MMDIINCIKSLFSFPIPSRKRRVIDDYDDFDLFSSPKFRKIHNPLNRHMDDIVISPVVVRRPVKPLRNVGMPKEIIVLDDINHRSERGNFTSTPTDPKSSKEVSFQDDDDVKLVGEYRAPKRNPKSNLFPFLRPFSTQNFSSDRTERRNDYSNGVSAVPKPSLNGSSVLKRPSLSSYINRLDDKKEFQNLLESHFSRENSFESSSQYFTPNSRLSKYDFSGRGRKILEISRQNSRNNSFIPAIDLTQDEPSGNSSAKLKVRDKIKKVLNSFEDETVEIQDSESDVEILPNPPSPKPDIKVEPVNSMKTVVDTSYVSNKKWLADVVANHRKVIENRERDLQYLKESSRKLGDINRDIRIGKLSRQIDECLSIKDTVLPIEEAEPELPPLTPEHYAMIDKAFRGSPNEVLARKFNLNITRKDILTLAGLNWLNDEVINFYMNLIMERSVQEKGKYPKVHCFNTFFYPKLLKDGPESLRRWTKRIDIFSMDIICVPIHLGVHWCMAIIDLRKQSINYYDSMGSSNQKCLNSLRRYLESEHQDKKKSSYDTSEFHLECVKDIPQQMNGSDCGMFSCTFAEFYTRDAKFSFKQEDMPYLRSKMVVEILSGELLIK